LSVRRWDVTRYIRLDEDFVMAVRRGSSMRNYYAKWPLEPAHIPEEIRKKSHFPGRED